MTRLGHPSWGTSRALTQHRDFAQGYRSRATLALPWPPCGINRIAIQVLNKHMLGVLLTSGEEPEAPRDLESSFCAPYRFPQTRSLETQSPAWFLAHSRHSDIDWTDI